MVRVKDTIRLRLEKMVDRYEEIGRSLADFEASAAAPAAAAATH